MKLVATECAAAFGGLYLHHGQRGSKAATLASIGRITPRRRCRGYHLLTGYRSEEERRIVLGPNPQDGAKEAGNCRPPRERSRAPRCPTRAARIDGVRSLTKSPRWPVRGQPARRASAWLCQCVFGPSAADPPFWPWSSRRRMAKATSTADYPAGQPDSIVHPS